MVNNYMNKLKNVVKSIIKKEFSKLKIESILKELEVPDFEYLRNGLIYKKYNEDSYGVFNEYEVFVEEKETGRKYYWNGEKLKYDDGVGDLNPENFPEIIPESTLIQSRLGGKIEITHSLNGYEVNKKYFNEIKSYLKGKIDKDLEEIYEESGEEHIYEYYTEYKELPSVSDEINKILNEIKSQFKKYNDLLDMSINKAKTTYSVYIEVFDKEQRYEYDIIKIRISDHAPNLDSDYDYFIPVSSSYKDRGFEDAMSRIHTIDDVIMAIDDLYTEIKESSV